MSYRAELKFKWHTGAALADFLKVCLRKKPTDSEGDSRVADLVDEHSCALAKAGGEKFLGFETGGAFRWACGGETRYLAKCFEDFVLFDEAELDEQAIHRTGNKSPHVANAHGMVAGQLPLIDKVIHKRILAEAQGGKIMVQLGKSRWRVRTERNLGSENLIDAQTHIGMDGIGDSDRSIAKRNEAVEFAENGSKGFDKGNAYCETGEIRLGDTEVTCHESADFFG